MFGRCVSLRQERSILEGKVLLTAAGDILHRGSHHDPFRLVVCDLVFPPGHPLLPIGVTVLEPGLDLADLPEDFRTLHLLCRCIHGNVRFVTAVQKCEHAVVLFLRKRIELMVVTLGTLDGDA